MPNRFALESVPFNWAAMRTASPFVFPSRSTAVIANDAAAATILEPFDKTLPGRRTVASLFPVLPPWGTDNACTFHGARARHQHQRLYSFPGWHCRIAAHRNLVVKCRREATKSAAIIPCPSLKNPDTQRDYSLYSAGYTELPATGMTIAPDVPQALPRCELN